MNKELLWNLTVNIGLLLLGANMFTSIGFIRQVVFDRRESIVGKTAIALLFSAGCILSTYAGMPYNGVIVNTRVISVLAAGLLGGPGSGIFVGLAGGVHRYFYGGFTAVACAVSTIFAGAAGAVSHRFFKRDKQVTWHQFLLTAFCELVHMGFILLICRPFDAAVELVKTIAVPMIIINSFGMLLFLTVLNNAVKAQDARAAGMLHDAFDVAKKALPVIRKDAHDLENIRSVLDIILMQDLCEGVMVTGPEKIIASREKSGKLELALSSRIPAAAEMAMKLKSPVILQEPSGEGAKRRYFNVIAAPLTVSDSVAGSLVIYTRKQWLSSESEVSFVEGLAALFSAQLDRNDAEYQKRLRRDAELRLLQSQVNPHFLYNALNTIGSVMREDQSKAQGLILSLSDYFRSTLPRGRDTSTLSEEIKQVASYLEIEKARFENRLQVFVEIENEVRDVSMPVFILQPLVENAVKYGADASGCRKVEIRASREDGKVRISVSDSGKGFPTDAYEELQREVPGEHFGLFSVHKRLERTFGEGCGLSISSTEQGSTVSFVIPYTAECKGEAYENRYN